MKRIAEQLSILNSQFAKELSRKRRNRKILLSVIAVLFAALLLLLTLVFPVREEARIDEDTNSLVICDIDEKYLNEFEAEVNGKIKRRKTIKNILISACCFAVVGVVCLGIAKKELNVKKSKKFLTSKPCKTIFYRKTRKQQV